MLTLPTAIAAYVEAANSQAPEQVAACFQQDATVLDEQHVRHGREEIAAWAADAVERYRSTIEPLDIASVDGQHLMRATVRGNFPGSPITLVFRFALVGQAIASLEITS